MAVKMQAAFVDSFKVNDSIALKMNQHVEGRVHYIVADDKTREELKAFFRGEGKNLTIISRQLLTFDGKKKFQPLDMMPVLISSDAILLDDKQEISSIVTLVLNLNTSKLVALDAATGAEMHVPNFNLFMRPTCVYAFATSDMRTIAIPICKGSDNSQSAPLYMPLPGEKIDEFTLSGSALFASLKESIGFVITNKN